jgi:hypothetical protein
MLVPVGQRIFSKAAGDVQDLELQLVQAFLFRLDTSPILMGAMAILEAVGGTASPIALTGIIVGDLLGGIMSWFSSANGVVFPTLIPTVPQVAANELSHTLTRFAIQEDGSLVRDPKQLREGSPVCVVWKL